MELLVPTQVTASRTLFPQEQPPVDGYARVREFDPAAVQRCGPTEANLTTGDVRGAYALLHEQPRTRMYGQEGVGQSSRTSVTYDNTSYGRDDVTEQHPTGAHRWRPMGEVDTHGAGSVDRISGAPSFTVEIKKNR